MIQNFKQKKWYIINDQNNGQYGKGNENDSTIKFSTEVVKPFLVDYSTNVAFKSCHPFIRSIVQLNDEHVETAEN